jgi:thiol-disulfide isomerase/thioredoxin
MARAREAVTRGRLTAALAGSAVLACVILWHGRGQAAPEGKPEPVPPAAAPAPDRPAPDYVVMDLPAIKRALRGGHGHIVLVHFWATWCMPCLEELPVIERFAREAKPKGVEVLSFSLDDPEKSGWRVSKVLSQAAPSLTRSIARVDDPDAFIGSFGTWEGSIPALFAFDADGKLRGELVGETDRRALDQLIGRLLKPKGRR